MEQVVLHDLSLTSINMNSLNCFQNKSYFFVSCFVMLAFGNLWYSPLMTQGFFPPNSFLNPLFQDSLQEEN